MKLEAALNDGVDLKQQLELKAQENKNLSTSLISLREANSELEVRSPAPSSSFRRADPVLVEKRAFKITSEGIEGGKSLAESAKEMERVRKTMAASMAEFDFSKKSLMKDLQNRCEKVRLPLLSPQNRSDFLVSGHRARNLSRRDARAVQERPPKLEQQSSKSQDGLPRSESRHVDDGTEATRRAELRIEEGRHSRRTEIDREE